MADSVEDNPVIKAEREKPPPLIRSTPARDWLLLTQPGWVMFLVSTDENDARLDYNTAHGDRRFGVSEYRSPAFRTIHDSALTAAAIFEQASDAPERVWLRQLALSLRLWASTVRSHDNFYFAQVIRDRRQAELAMPPGSCWLGLTIRTCSGGTTSSGMSWTMRMTFGQC